MPFLIVKNKDGSYKVDDLKSHRITAKNTTLKKAKNQIRLVESIVNNKKIFH
jgi:hypothetical protein